MIRFTSSLPPASERLTSLALGPSIIGGSFSPAHSADRPASDHPTSARQTMERPIAERQTVERPIVERHIVDRPNIEHPNMERQIRERSATPEGRVSREQGNRTTTPDQAPIRRATNDIIQPRPMERCTVMPTAEVWRRRDIMAEIQSMARRGFISVHPIDEDLDEFTGVSEFPAGWKAYGFRVPPGEKLHVRLNHVNEGWFRLSMVNKWGSLEKGMLQNIIPTGNPEVSYTNYTKESRNVYVIVDDSGWMSSKEYPFKMKVTRSWDPAKKNEDRSPIITGIWAQKKIEPTLQTPTKDLRTDAAIENPLKG